MRDGFSFAYHRTDRAIDGEDVCTATSVVPITPAVWLSPRIVIVWPVPVASLMFSWYCQIPGPGAAVVVMSHVSSEVAPGVVAEPVEFPVSVSPGAMAAI